MKTKYLKLSPLSLLFQLILICPISGFAQAADLDESFGSSGKVIFDSGYDDEWAYSIEIQPDGKILVAGTSNSYPNGSLTLMRFNTNGDPDESFGTGGAVVTFIEGSDSFVSSMAIQSDGKIVVTGGTATADDEYDIVLARYNTDGSLDESFGVDGIVITDLSNFDIGYAILIQEDDKILVAGYTYMPDGEDFLLLRYDEDGSIDGSFGEFGITTTDFGGFYSKASSMELQSDGKIILGGFVAPFNEDFALARYKSNGHLDLTFGDEGKVITGLGDETDHINDIAIQSDDKIIMAGYSYTNGALLEDFVLARLNADGTIDESFGLDGWTTIDQNESFNELLSITLQHDEKILACGQIFNGSDYDFVIFRFNTDGNLDASFGDEGMVTTDFDNTDDWAFDIAVQDDKKIVVAGNSTTMPAYQQDFAVARYMGEFGVVSIEQNAENTLINISPNPFTNEIIFSCDQNISESLNAEFILYDILGNELIRQIISEQETTFNTEYLIPGIYFVSYKLGHDVKNMVIVKS